MVKLELIHPLGEGSGSRLGVDVHPSEDNVEIHF